MPLLIKQQGLFLVEAHLPHKVGAILEPLNLIFDTGAALTIVSPQFTDYLGYSARADAFGTSALDGAAGRSIGYVIKVRHFKCLGHTLHDFVIACHDMDTRLGVAGLLGMNFLEHFRIDANYNTGVIHAIERI